MLRGFEREKNKYIKNKSLKRLVGKLPKLLRS